MLVLSRKPGEHVCIGSDIVVKVLFIDGNKVRLGFEAPPDVEVHRREVYERIVKEKKEKKEEKEEEVASSGQKK